MPERELTRAERADIRVLVKSTCSNYDHQYGCLPLDSACYMLNKWWTGTYCVYFQHAVLPTNPALEASLMKTDERMKPCQECGVFYVPATSQAYCSDRCRVAGRRKAERERKRDRRKNRG